MKWYLHHLSLRGSADDAETKQSRGLLPATLRSRLQDSARNDSTRGSILASTLILFGLTLMLTSVILALSTHRLRQTATRETISRQSDLKKDARAWLEWRLRESSPDSAFPIGAQVRPNGAAWTVTAESSDECAGTRTLRLTTDTGEATQRMLVRATPITTEALRVTDDLFSAPAGTTVEGVIKDRTSWNGHSQSFPPDMIPLPNNHPNVFAHDASTRGYHLRLNGGTLLVSRVTKAEARWSYDDENKWSKNDEAILEEKLLRSITLDPLPCSPRNFFLVDGPTWVDGSTNRSVTIFTLGPAYPLDPPHPIIINGAITKEPGGRIGLIASGSDIVIPLHAPENLTIHAALYAVNGTFLRRHYCVHASKAAPGARCRKEYAGQTMRQTVSIIGSIVTRSHPQWNWFELGKLVSGYRTAEIIHDASLIDHPPPYFPRHRSPFIVTPIEQQQNTL